MEKKIQLVDDINQTPNMQSPDGSVIDRMHSQQQKGTKHSPGYINRHKGMSTGIRWNYPHGISAPAILIDKENT